jgi:hypothetical protein
MEQPYSMCPVVHRAVGDCEVKLPAGSVQLTFPALGGCRTMDAPEAVILSVLWAEPKARRAAKARGDVRLPLRPVKGMDMVWAAGLAPGKWRPAPAGLVPVEVAS